MTQKRMVVVVVVVVLINMMIMTMIKMLGGFRRRWMGHGQGIMVMMVVVCVEVMEMMRMVETTSARRILMAAANMVARIMWVGAMPH